MAKGLPAVAGLEIGTAVSGPPTGLSCPALRLCRAALGGGSRSLGRQLLLSPAVGSRTNM